MSGRFVGGKALLDLDTEPKKFRGFGDAEPGPAAPASPLPAASPPSPVSPTADTSPPVATRPPAEASPPAPAGLAAEGSPTTGEPSPPPEVGPTAPASPAAEVVAAASIWAALPEVRGHLRLPHRVTDALCRFLDPFELAVFLQLYRLSHGFGKDTCEIGLPKLAERSNMGENTAQRTVKRLETKGLVKKMGYRMGKGIEQGTVYWVAGEGSLTAPASLAAPAPNKNTDLKEISKGSARVKKDYSACPDCGGRGLYYPEGFDKGVAKCRHERMAK